MLHRNCYTAVNFENQYEREKDSMGREANDVEKDDLGWVAGYNDLTIPTKYIELIDSHVAKLTGISLEPILPPHNGNIMGELG